MTQYATVGVFLTWFFLTLTSFRLTRFITTDDLTEPFRNLVDRRFGPNSNWAILVSCGWCAGTYITVAVFTIAASLMSVPLPALQMLSTMSVVGLLSNWDD